MTGKYNHKKIRHLRIVLLLVIVSLAMLLGIGYFRATTAQTSAPVISLNSPVSFPVDI